MPIDPETSTPADQLEAAGADAKPNVNPDAVAGDGGGESSGAGDTGPLESISLEPAEDGGAVITHHPKMPKRVKAMDHEDTKPKKHVAKNHEELMKHLDKHAKRMKP